MASIYRFDCVKQPCLFWILSLCFQNVVLYVVFIILTVIICDSMFFRTMGVYVILNILLLFVNSLLSGMLFCYILSGAPAFTPAFSRVRVTSSLVLCLCFVSSVLLFTASDYPFGIFKLFCHAICQLNYLNCGSLCSLVCGIMSPSLLYTIFVSTIYLLVSMAYIKLCDFKHTTNEDLFRLISDVLF